VPGILGIKQKNNSISVVMVVGGPLQGKIF